MATSTKQVYTLEVVSKGIDQTNAQLKELNKNLKGNRSTVKDTEDSYSKLGQSTDAYGRRIKGTAQATNNSTKAFSKMSQGMQGTLVPAYATVAATVFALTAAFGALARAADLQILIDSAEEMSAQTGRSLISLANNMKDMIEESNIMNEGGL